MKRFLAVATVFLAACSSTTVDTTDPTADTTSTTGVFGRAEVEALIADIGPIDSIDQTRQVVEMVGLLNEPDLIPYAHDAARLGETETLMNAVRIFARITGVDPPAADVGAQWLFFGDWIMNNAPNPGAAYPAWKAALFANIDPAFEPLISQVQDPVLASRLQFGGVRRGGIPELNDAPTISIAEADYMTDDEIVFGAVVNGVARAYPVRILGHHELANDTLGGEDVSLIYCTLCRTPVFYSAEVAGMVLDFQTSGLLMNSNKVMVDVETDTLWNQLTGEAIAGQLAGEVLTKLPMTVTTWADWIADHPDSDVQAIPASAVDPTTGLAPTGGYSYEPGDAYNSYYASEGLWFPALDVPDDFAKKAEMVTLDVDGGQIAVELDALLDAGGLVTSVGGTDVVFVASANGARAYDGADGLEVVDGAVVFDGQATTATEDALVLPDGTALPRLVSGQSFWFAWYGNFPDTDWWPRA
ncbi:MAG: DUF3179 domain-containing protein [Acidimicrobiia bacterium]|nr:DUF3179 domain-containing protein [Acidimicrobiia bacterium]